MADPQSSPTSPPGQSNKRHRNSNTRTALSYPRKRAVTACQLCRARKTKCDNVRPKCRFCQDSGADCVYEDRSNHSSFDPASLAIIEQLNQISQKLDSFGPSPLWHPAVQQSDQSCITPYHLRNTSKQSPHNQPQAETSEDQDDAFHRIPSAHISADDILLWPIFHGKYPPECLVDVLLAAEGNTDTGPVVTDYSGASAYGAYEDEILRLVDNFLAHVHTKNPILDIEALTQAARRIAELGPGWDEMSCLVLLTCALGSVARPFGDTWKYYNENGIKPGITSHEYAKQDLRRGEHYFSMSRKRIGLLKSSIVRSQCYFWSGVYLMYTVKPVEAWQNFLQASTTLHIYLKARSYREAGVGESENVSHKLEQRLYWSCFKSECELSLELSLPKSNITTIRSPGMFPSPPTQPSLVEVGESSNSPESYFDTPSSRDSFMRSRRNLAAFQTQELSWYYYLTELALRRIGNRVLSLFYKDGLTLNMPILDMVSVAADFEVQCSQWYSGLPSSLQFDIEDIDSIPQEELIVFVRGRFWETRLFVYLPFLYYAVHTSQDDPYREVIQQHVYKALLCSQFFIKPMPPIHRHHGIWFFLRGSMVATLLLVAAIKCGTLDVPRDWPHLIERHLTSLRYWEAESPDIRRAREITEDMYRDITSDRQQCLG